MTRDQDQQEAGRRRGCAVEEGETDPAAVAVITARHFDYEAPGWAEAVQEVAAAPARTAGGRRAKLDLLARELREALGVSDPLTRLAESAAADAGGSDHQQQGQ